MRYGLFTSVILHVAILAWALFTIQAQQELRVPEPDPIVTGLVTEGELTKLRQGVRTAKQLEAQPKEAPKSEPSKKEAAKPKPVAAAPELAPPEPDPPPKEEPKKEPEKQAAVPPPPPPPAPAVDEQKKLEEMLKEQERKADDLRKAEEQKRLDEEQKRKEAEAKKKRDEERRKKLADLKKKQDEEKKRKEAEAKSKWDAEKIAALLNKVPDKGSPRPSVPLDDQAKSLNKGPVLGAPEGRDQKISASEIAMLKGIISTRLRECWRLPSGGGGSDTPVVTLRWRMKPDGNIDGDPQVEQPRSDPLFRIAAEAALRAVRACTPFPLPPEKYSSWKTITWEFDPSQML